jgi:hypothetical protein
MSRLTPTRTLAPFLLPFALLAAPALVLAADGMPEGAVALPGALPYAVFETTVEHADLAACPQGFDGDKVFCRLTLAAEAAHVFVFSLDGDQPLVAVKSYALDEGVLSF